MCAKIYRPALDKYRETACSGEVLISRALVSCSLNFDLRRSIDPNFRLCFVHLDSTSDFDVLPFDARQYGRFRDWVIGGDLPETRLNRSYERLDGMLVVWVG